MRFYSDQTHTAFQEAFQEDLKYSDFFRDHLPQHIGDVRREFIFYGLETGLEKADLNQTTLTCTTELNTRYERTFDNFETLLLLARPYNL